MEAVAGLDCLEEGGKTGGKARKTEESREKISKERG